MHSFEDITEDIQWREDQLLISKTLPFLHNFSNSHKEFLIKSSILNIYAIWEGFIQQAFQIYVRELNKLQLQRDMFCLSILAHSVDSQFPQLKEYPSEFQGRKKFIQKLDSYFQNEFSISPIINTQSNVEWEVLNRILHRFDLTPVENYPYKQQLKSLLRYRNRIAHGDNTVVIDEQNLDEYKSRIDEFTKLVKNLMDEVYLKIYQGFNIYKSHLRK